jgi:hypothetical protein
MPADGSEAYSQASGQNRRSGGDGIHGGVGDGGRGCGALWTGIKTLR